MRKSIQPTQQNNPSQNNEAIFERAFELHQQGHLAQAEFLYKKLLRKQPIHFDALHLLGVLSKQKGQDQRAVDLISQAININPDSAAAHSNLGVIFQEMNRFDEALASYDCALAIKPDNAEALSNRGNTLQSLRRFDEALACYDYALAIKPNYVDALYNRGKALQNLNRFDEALVCYNRALALKPDHIESLFNRGNVLQHLKRFNEAFASYNRVLTLKPDHVEALFNRSNVLQNLKHFEEALASYNRVLVFKPNYVEALSNRGITLQCLKRFEESLASYDCALTFNSDDAKVLFNRGVALQSLNAFKDALTSYNRALAIQPDYAEAIIGSAFVLQSLKCFSEALIKFERALAIKPDYDFLFGIWLHTKMTICDWNAFDKNLNVLEKGIERGEKITIPFVIQAVSLSAALQKKAIEIYTKEKHPSNFLLPPLAKHVHQKIKLAYFSSDFRNHVVATLTAELFEHHDRSKFEIIAFSFSPVDYKDNMRLQLEATFDQFIDVRQQSDEQIVRLARELEIDIAIDLNGFTEGGRIDIFAMRAAPIQVNYLGYLGTMGANYMDYLLADPTLIPIDYQSCYSEKIAYLPHTFQVNNSKLHIADKEFTRAELDLPEQGFVFCCFNNHYKITPRVFNSWMRILHRVEGSILWLLGDNVAAEANLRLAAISQGINAERLIFAQRLSMPEHLARHRLAGLFLDTQPYNAGATASAALWTGLPVLTCLGETFSGRMAASLLNAIGLPELITSSLEGYETLAVKLGTQPELLAAIKQKLANNRLTYPLFDTFLFTQHIESAYQIMFDRHQAGLAPEHIYVSA